MTDPADRKRLLVIVNPHATTVSDRLKNLVIYALQGRYEVEVETTRFQDHATELGREAADGGYDLVVAFGGDGTVNEVANGLAGTDIPMAVLPGGNTNVVCRTLGVPNDVVDATEHLLALADHFPVRKIDLGRVNGRHFVFACGAGIDATVVEQVDSNPKLKSRLGPWFYTWSGVSRYLRDYWRNPVRMRIETEGRTVEGMTVLAQNSDPFTYFGSRSIHACENVALDDGRFGLIVLKRGTQRDIAALIPRLVSGRLKVSGHSQVEELSRLERATISSLSLDGDGGPRPFPLQVDGDYIGEFTEATIEACPGALTVLA